MKMDGGVVLPSVDLILQIVKALNMKIMELKVAMILHFGILHVLIQLY